MSSRFLALLCCLAVVSCDQSPPDDDTTGDDDATGDDDSGGYGPDGCIETAVGVTPFVEVTAEVSEQIPLVLKVKWQTDQEGTNSVRFGESADDLATESIVEGGYATGYFSTLKGLHASTEIHYRVFVEIGDELICTPDLTATTGPLAPGLPSITLSVVDTEQAAGGYTITPIFTDGSVYIVILDQDGEYVWFWDHDPFPSLLASLSMDRRSVLMSKDTFLPEAKIHKILFEGDVREVDAPYMGYDFVEIEPGHYGYLGGEVRTIDGQDIYGDTIVEVWEDGTIETIWRMMDDIPPVPDVIYPELMGQYPGVAFYTHVNSISYDPNSDTYLIVHGRAETIQIPDMIACVDRPTGELLWTLSATAGDFTYEEDIPLVGWPHSSRMEPDGTLLVFNRYSPIGDYCSEVTQIELDEANGTAARVWSYAADPCLHATFLGNARRLWNGNVVANYAASGQIDEVTPDGELVWRLNLALGAGFGQGERAESLY